MDLTVILQLTKDRLGIRSEVRDTYINAIIKGVVDDLQETHGVKLNLENYSHVMFVVDYSTWRYLNRDSTGALPRHLQFRLHNLIVRSVRNNDGDI